MPRFFFSPPLLAAFIQAGTALFVWWLLLILSKAGFTFSLFVWVIAQGSVAAAITIFFKMDWWWRLIQFCFPLCVALFIFFKLPSYLYLLGLLALASMYWTVFQTRVPYFPSNASLITALSPLLPADQAFKFVDIGSGLGGLLTGLARTHPRAAFLGVEIAPLPWLLSCCRGMLLRSSVRFRFGNYAAMNLAEFDIVFAYLSPAVMQDVWQKVCTEMRPGTLFMSYEFIVPGVPPQLCVNIATNEPILYIWRI